MFSVLQNALTSILSIVLDDATLALREGRLPAAHFRPALTLMRLLGFTHHCNSSPLLLQLELVAWLQEKCGIETLCVVANLAVVHKQAVQWEQHLPPGAPPEVLVRAMKMQVAALAHNELDAVVWETAVTLRLLGLEGDREHSVELLKSQQPLAFCSSRLQYVAAAELQRKLLKRGQGPLPQVPVRRSQSIRLLGELPGPSEEEMQVILPLSY